MNFLVAVLVLLPFAARADIRDTRHNFVPPESSESSAGRADLSQARQVCVFCHTPSAGAGEGLGGRDDRQSSPGATWQGAVAREQEYRIYDDNGGANLARVPTGQKASMATGAISLSCLSCHDGVAAMAMTTTASDHPFGVPYRGFPLDPDLRRQERDLRPPTDQAARDAVWEMTHSEFRAPRSAEVNKREIWWVSSTNSAIRTKNDLPFYPRRVGEGDKAVVVPFVECTSCHDPHNTRATFLRVDNAQSELCMTCHIK